MKIDLKYNFRLGTWKGRCMLPNGETIKIDVSSLKDIENILEKYRDTIKEQSKLIDKVRGK